MKLNRQKPAPGSPIKSILKAACIITLLICCYLGVYHSHRHFQFDIILTLVLLGMLCLAALNSLYFNTNGKWAKVRILTFFVLVGGPMTTIVIVLHENYKAQQLADYGTDTYGIVTNLYRKKAKSRVSYYADFEYNLNSKRWIQQTRNDDHRIKMGDTLKLRCSTVDPEVFERKD